jgi:hypothetical protein
VVKTPSSAASTTAHAAGCTAQKNLQ